MQCVPLYYNINAYIYEGFMYDCFFSFPYRLCISFLWNNINLVHMFIQYIYILQIPICLNLYFLCSKRTGFALGCSTNIVVFNSLTKSSSSSLFHSVAYYQLFWYFTLALPRFSKNRPLGRFFLVVAMSVCLSVYLSVCLSVPSPCDFFRGLSLALRSHDQIPVASVPWKCYA